MVGKIFLILLCSIIAAIMCPVLANPPLPIGKSTPNGHLFSYDQKFRESTNLQNYAMNVSASKEFTDATRLSTAMQLKATSNLTELVINADFIGIGRLGYLVLDPETGDKKEEMSRISHMFIGNFSMNEHIRVIKDHMCEEGFLGCV